MASHSQGGHYDGVARETSASCTTFSAFPFSPVVGSPPNIHRCDPLNAVPAVLTP